jgi:hypothetical protein
MTHEYNIAMLLATRGRTESLGRSVRSLISLADHPDRLQLMFAFDNDDTAGTEYFKSELQPWLDEREISYTAMQFERQGYHRLHIYNNKLAEQTDARWLMIWNDDAVMETKSWDTEIMNHEGEFKLLAFHTHLDHPYSIFPILPRKWYELLGYISPHSVQDGWLSQQAYMLNIWERIPVWVLHDRADITGNNNDATFRERASLEGRPFDEADFHSRTQIELRHQDCAKLAMHMRDNGISIEFFENIFKGTQDPWEKLAKNDVNRQMVQFDNPHRHFVK